MHPFHTLLRGLRSLFDKRGADREIEEEIDGFFEASLEHKQRTCRDADQARRAALAELGSRNAIKHHVWSSRWESTIDNLAQDARVSLRALCKRPAFTAVALLSLSLGIGANTAIFTLIQQLLLRNLPVRSPEQLVAFGDATNSGVAGGIDLGQYGLFPWYVTRQLEANPGPFQGIAAMGSFSPKVSVRIAQASPAQIALASLVSGNFFSVLGAQALIGRTITPADDTSPGTAAVAVASYHFWQHSLSSDPGVTGRIITINGTAFELIGVMPPGFEGVKLGLELPDLWTPSTMQAAIMQAPSMLTPASGPDFMNVFGRLTPQAAADQRVRARFQGWLDQQIHAAVRAGEGTGLSPARQQEIERETVPLISSAQGVSYLQDAYRESLWILMAVVAVVLLIACANLANFLMARAATRQREIATRLALGSSRARIARQSIIETLLLSVGGGLLGLAVAFAATRFLIAFVSQGSTWIAVSAAPNATVLVFTLGVSILTGLLFGSAPALSGARTEAHASLSSSSRSSAGSRASRWWPKLLVIAQITLSLTLLVAAGLLLQTLRNLRHQDYGFERKFLLVAQFDAKLAGYTPVQTADLHQRMLDRLSAIPGVQSAALAGTPPISSGNWRSNISVAGYTPAPKENTNSILNRVSARYFETAGISIVAGRPIGPSDTANNLKIVVVNQALARHFFPKGNALGHTLTIGIDSVQGPWQIVGIARDTRAGNPRSRDTEVMTYIPLAQIPLYAPGAPAAGSTAPEQNQDRFAGFILLRTSGDPSARVADLRAAMASVDPNLPLLNVSTINQEVSQMMGDEELISSLTGVFAFLALLLAAVGLYGVMSYNVAQRTSEMGVRLALGAQKQNLLWIILREALVLLFAGVVLGLPLSLAAARFGRDKLFGLSANDPLTCTVALLVVTIVVMLSAWLPARRAAAINPVDALRCEG